MHELRKKSLAEKASSFWRALHSVSRFELTELRVGVRCPLWVKSGHVQCNRRCPLYSQKQTCAVH
jgi:hypothetical protein